MTGRLLIAAMLLVDAVGATAQTAVPVRAYAAGSLREALVAIGAAHEARTGVPVAIEFGASGLLRQRIEQGAPAQVFASADMEHPQRLAGSGQWQAPVVFARNVLCALVAPNLQVSSAGLLDLLLRPEVRLGTSTPKADPSGDYAWALFHKAQALRPGAYELLDAKALKLAGAADSAQAPAGRSTYAWIMERGQADVFLTYCTNAMAARREAPQLQVVSIPAELQVGAAYGVTLRNGAGPAAAQFAQSLLAPEAQAVFRRLGFGAP